MLPSKIGLVLKLALILFSIAQVVAISINMDGEGRASATQAPTSSTVPGQSTTNTSTTSTTSTTTTATSSSTTGSTGGSGEQNSEASPKAGYSETPESVMRLLKDSKASVDKKVAGKYGVHSTGNFTLSVRGVMFNARAEGDQLPPDKGVYWLEMHDPYVSRTLGSLYDGIEYGEFIYLKPAWSNKWLGSKKESSAFSDALSAFDFSKYATNPRMIGQESMNSNGQVYHVRIDIDAVAVAEEAKNHVSEHMKEFHADELEKLKTSVITIDVWIGVRDLLPYQMTERFQNTDLDASFDDMEIFHSWGKEVNIASPPPENVLMENGNGVCGCPYS